MKGVYIDYKYSTFIEKLSYIKKAISNSLQINDAETYGCEFQSLLQGKGLLGRLPLKQKSRKSQNHTSHKID